MGWFGNVIVKTVINGLALYPAAVIVPLARLAPTSGVRTAADLILPRMPPASSSRTDPTQVGSTRTMRTALPALSVGAVSLPNRAGPGRDRAPQLVRLKDVRCVLARPPSSPSHLFHSQVVGASAVRRKGVEVMWKCRRDSCCPSFLLYIRT